MVKELMSPLAEGMDGQDPLVSDGADAPENDAVVNGVVDVPLGKDQQKNATKSKIAKWLHGELRRKGLTQFENKKHVLPVLEECGVPERITAKDMVAAGYAVVMKAYDPKKPTEPGVYMLCTPADNETREIKPTSTTPAPVPVNEAKAIVEVQEKAKANITNRVKQVRTQKQGHLSAMEKFSRAIVVLQREITLLELEEKHLLPFADPEVLEE